MELSVMAAPVASALEELESVALAIDDPVSSALLLVDVAHLRVVLAYLRSGATQKAAQYVDRKDSALRDRVPKEVWEEFLKLLR